MPDDVSKTLDAALADWTKKDGTKRLWSRDATLWTNRDEAKWLGWLDIAKNQLAGLPRLREVAEIARPYRHVVVLGMGGSSLCPDVLSRTFGALPGRPRLLILDSTDPAQIRRLRAELDVGKTLFIVSSKSGGTLEPNIFLDYFLDEARRELGAKEAGLRFVAVTDPGSKVEEAAKANGFRKVCHGVPSIGGRYSALSDFGMAPAAAMGLDVADFLGRAQRMADACRDSADAANPGVALGVALGALANAGRDKLTVVASPGVSSFGAWLEQLVAESTGKLGKAIVPVDGETPGEPASYGKDRVFAHVRLASEPDASLDARVDAIAAAGHPVLRIDVADAMDLGAEFFRWEIATAVAGSLLGINPFDQPDVEASKIETKKLTTAFEATGALPAERPFRTGAGLSFFADARNEGELAGAATPEAVVATHLARIRPGDYFGVLAYVDMSPGHEAIVQAIRHAVRRKKCVATCVGFGPRFLHSTGQAYKGGPATGVFLQITCNDAADLPVPGKRFSFGVVKAAQARGDFDVLAERGRRALRVHLGADVARGLSEVLRLVEAALA
jgi:transaldolase/glucose-6-phosphate isomerase